MRANFVMSGISAGIRRNAGMTIALILVTSIALTFVGGGILANTEISRFRHTYEGKINVSVYLCATSSQSPCLGQTTQAQTAALQSELNADPMVRSTSYVSEQEQYNRAKVYEGPSVAKFLTVGELPASFTVKLNDLKRDYTQFAAKYGKAAGVSQVNNQFKTIKTLLVVLDGIRLCFIVLAIVVMVASILLIAIFIQVAAAQRKNETSIMRLVGASRWMTELPFMLEVVIATLIGGVISIVLIWVGKHYVLDGVFKIPVENGLIPNLGINDVLVAGGAGLITGIVLSALTAIVTLRLRVRL